jgi:hypothetical protein
LARSLLRRPGPVANRLWVEAELVQGCAWEATLAHDNPFASLLKRQATAGQREYLHRVHDDLRLADDDALWAFVQVVQDFCSSTRADCERNRTASRQEQPSTGWWIPFSLGLAAQTVIIAAAMYAGALAASPRSPAWMTPAAASSHSAARTLAAVLSAPAGWLAFAFLLPFAFRGTWLGFRLKSNGEGLLGVTVVAASALGTLACAVALWWLLRP